MPDLDTILAAAPVIPVLVIDRLDEAGLPTVFAKAARIGAQKAWISNSPPA